MANWYYAVGGQTLGPVDAEGIRTLARQGTLTPSSYVVAEGETAWQSLADVESSFGLQRNPWNTYSDPPAGITTAPAAPVAPGAPSAPAEPTPASPYAPAPGAPAPSGWGEAAGGGGGWGAPPPSGPNTWAQPGEGTAAGWGAGQSAPSGWPPPSGQAWSGGGWNDGSGQPYPGTQWANAGPGYGPGGQPLAEWWQRLVALILDGLILAVPGSILFAIVAWSDFRDRIDRNNGGFSVTYGGREVAGQLLWAAVALVYYAVLNGRGQTLGKMALGIKVVGPDGGPIGTGKGFARHILQQIAWLLSCFGAAFVLIDGLWPLWDGQRQALHDKIAGSLVVKTR